MTQRELAPRQLAPVFNLLTAHLLYPNSFGPDDHVVSSMGHAWRASLAILTQITQIKLYPSQGLIASYCCRVLVGKAQVTADNLG